MTDEEHRRRIAAELEQLLEQLEAARDAGDLTHAEWSDRLLRATDQQAKLLHFYPPEKMEVVFVDKFSDAMPVRTAPSPAVLDAMRKHLAERKAEEKDLDEL